MEGEEEAVDVHPWSNYEIARLRDEERLKLARAAMLSLEARAAGSSETEPESRESASSWLDRIRRRGSQPVIDPSSGSRESVRGVQ